MMKMKRLVVEIVACVMALAIMGCEVDGGRIESSAYMQMSEVKGDSKNCAVVLHAEQGTSYTATVQSEGDWAHFSGGANSVTGEMASDYKTIYLYFDKNATDAVREAVVQVSFSDGASSTVWFKQLTYDASIAFQREWAELPLCKVQDNYIFNTHYGTMGVKNNARNYTYCFDPDVRASLWVAYPLHKSYTSGSGNRDYSDFGYDPKVEAKYQANLVGRSYTGWYDRGHQLPAADRKCSQQMMDQTFYATNMTPQQANFNQNKWGVLEGRVRNMVCSDTLYVVTGAYFDGQHHSSIAGQTTDKSGNICPTPTYYYKALLRTKKGNTGKRIDEITDASQVRAIAFWMEHANTGDNTDITSADCISVEELETLTGFTFFPMLDDAIEAQVKAKVVPSEWGIN